MPPAKRKKGKGDEEGGSGRKWPRSTLSTRDIDQLNRKFPGFSFRVPTAEETPGIWIDGELCIFIEFFKDGPLLPLPDFLVTFFRHFKLVPTMLMPNTLIVLRGLRALYNSWTIPWNKESIMSLITFTCKDPGCYYAQPKHAHEFKMIGIPSSRHRWKERYAFVKSCTAWPISTIPEIPHANAYKGWGITKRLSYILKSHGTLPLCVNMNTLEILPGKEEEVKKAAAEAPRKKKRKTEDIQASKIIKSAIASEGEAETGDSDAEEDSSIKWSEEEPAPAAASKKITIKLKKQPGVVIKETSSVPEAPKEQEASSLKGKEKMADPEPTAESSNDSMKMAAEIAEGIGAFTAEDIGISTADRPEAEKIEEEWEWHHDIDKEEFSMRKNTRYRFIPECNTTGLPLLLSALLKHPDDDKLLSSMNDLEVGALQTHTSLTNLILGQCLTERLMVTYHELHDNKTELAEMKEMASLQKELAQRYKKESETLGSVAQSQDIEHKETVAALRASEATATEELKSAKAEVLRLQQLQKATEDRMQQERTAAAASKTAMGARIAELEKALAQKDTSQATVAAQIEKAIEGYKDSDAYQYKLKDVGLYGFNLLKKVLIREKKLTSTELNSYDYDDCILADDE